jgi:hypothetical protein
MASIRNEVLLQTTAAEVWDALRDFGALHTRLVPGFVTDCKLEGDERIVTFANGMVAREVLVDADGRLRRLAYAIVGAARPTTALQSKSSTAAKDRASSFGSSIYCRMSWHRA